LWFILGAEENDKHFSEYTVSRPKIKTGTFQVQVTNIIVSMLLQILEPQRNSAAGQLV
jgi:hypothetical protein